LIGTRQTLADPIREFMVDQGYLISEVGDPRFERSKKGLIVIMPVKEGPLFRLGRIRFENSTLFSQEQLLEIFGVTGGEIAASFGTKSREGFERLKRIYSNYGYLN
jgi:outer membrane protein assembly factor BamA